MSTKGRFFDICVAASSRFSLRDGDGRCIRNHPQASLEAATQLIFLIGIIVLLFSVETYAAPVFGKIFDLLQPDGSTVKVRIWGDEFYQVVETLDGYTLVQEPQSRRLCYAVLSGDGSELVSSGIVAGIDRSLLPANLQLRPHIRINNASAEAKVKAARNRFIERKNRIELFSATGPAPEQIPTLGHIRGICLIIDFPNERYTIPASDVNDFCNKVGYDGYGNHGSIRDYFYDVSDGKLVYTNYVSPIYYTARYNKSYYEDPSYDLGVRATELVYEALYDLELRGFDFSQYDSNNDGYIDAVNCYYAGSVRGFNSGLWPHSWVMDDFSADSVTSYRYQISSMEDGLELYTFCHENGHMICGWPDLYDRNFDGSRYDSVGVGEYCLMAAYDLNNMTNPVEPCAYLKYIAGWTDIVRLENAQTDLELTAGVNRFYWFQNPSFNNELFMISYRAKAGRDAGLPDEGLTLWHIDARGCNDNQQMTADAHYLVTLVQADGRWDLENNINEGDNSDLFDNDRFDRCTPFTDPNTNFWNGSSSALCISDIRMGEDVPSDDGLHRMLFNYDSAFPVKNVTASASGDIEGQGPENTVNGSGMRNDLHSTQGAGMWLSPACAPGTAWILYEFDKPYMLHQMWVWNYNDEFVPRTGAGMKDVLIEYSLDGQEYVTLDDAYVFADAPSAANYEYSTVVDFDSIIARYVKITALSNWGQADRYGLGEVLFLYVPLWARQPAPTQDATDVDLDVTLNWVAGTRTVEHNVYFGTDIQEVMDGRSPDAITGDSCYGPLELERDTRYYWRVDQLAEVETPSLWAGEVWSFKTGDYYIVDDFESYSNFPSREVWNTWIDGWEDMFNGSWIESEYWIVRGGYQSMLFYYDNSSTRYAEATVSIDDLDIGRDWTIGSPNTLSLWFYGDYWNSTDVKMYVKLNGFRVNYSGDMNALIQTFWHRWDINLADFGIKLDNIRNLTIGTERNGTYGGYGVLYFDDVRLYNIHR